VDPRSWPEAFGTEERDFGTQEPRLLALYRKAEPPESAVAAWVVALPDGGAVILSDAGDGPAPIVTTMDNVRRRWTKLMDAELVRVARRPPVRLAA
jgi:hypothetical protein